MGCFTVPAALGIATLFTRNKFPQAWHADWLNMIVFGGTAGLIVEHIARGEIIFSPPFLTALSSPAGVAELLNEMVNVGIPVTVALVLIWAAAVLAYEKLLLPIKTSTEGPVASPEKTA
jgi:hypothetical protein